MVVQYRRVAATTYSIMSEKAHTTTKNFIFGQPELIEAAFILGVAHANKMLKLEIKTRWITFLQYHMPAIYDRNLFTDAEYQKICEFVDEVQNWAAMFAEAAPQLIARANEAAPKDSWKENWKPKETHQQWRLRTWNWEETSL